MQVYVELFNGFKWRKDFPSKNKIWQPYWIFLLFEFFQFSKMSRRGPKIVHPDHPLIQLLGPPAPESISDLRDYNIPLDYGKKMCFSSRLYRSKLRSRRLHWSLVTSSRFNWMFVAVI